MTTFLTDLWESIFTAGPTPTLLLATNVTFAALQLLLFILLVATYSLHFVALSLICGGLWYSINWFAVEVGKMQEEKNQQEKREGQEGATKAGGNESKDVGQSTTTTDAGQSTALEGSAAQQGGIVPTVQGDANAPKVRVRGGPSKIMGVMASAKAAREGGDDSLQPGGTGDKSGDMSSSSEWEHVSDGDR